MLKRGDSKSVLNMKMALHSLVSFEMWGVEGLIMAGTVVYQSKQKLKKGQGQFLQHCGHRLKM